MALAKDQITLINVNDGYVGNDGKTYILNTDDFHLLNNF